MPVLLPSSEMTPLQDPDLPKKRHSKSVSWITYTSGDGTEPLSGRNLYYPGKPEEHPDDDDDDLEDGDHDSDSDRIEGEEQDTLTKLNIGLSTATSLDTLKNVEPTSIEALHPSSLLSQHCLSPTPSGKGPFSIEETPRRPMSPHRRHRTAYSISSTSSSSTTSSHQQLHHLNLPPYSPSPSAPQSPILRSYRSPSPTLKYSRPQSPIFKNHHRAMSSISSTLSSSSSVYPQQSSRFTFPPPTPDPISQSDHAPELDYSFSFSPSLSSAPSANSDDSSLNSPYILQSQTDLQDIFTELAHKERRLLEAREQLLAAEKDLKHFKHQWNSVLSGDPESKKQTHEILHNQLVTSPRRPEALARPNSDPSYLSHGRNRHGKSSSSMSAPVYSTRSSKRLLPLRHSIGHASELGLCLEDDVESNPLCSSGLAHKPSSHRLQESSSILGNFSYFFREKLHGLFDLHESQSKELVDPTTNTPIKRTSSLTSTPASCSSVSSSTSSMLISPSSSMSSVSSSPSMHIPSPCFSKSISTPFSSSICESSFIARFFSNMGPAGVVGPPMFPNSSSFSTTTHPRSTALKMKFNTASPTRIHHAKQRGTSFSFSARPMSMPMPMPMPPTSPLHRTPGIDNFHQSFAPLLSKFNE